MPNFTGQLNTNVILGALYNMIISLQTYSDNVKHNYTLVERAKVDGGLYGDTKLFVATDVLSSKPWGNDAEASNLLKLHRPPAPKTQAIALNVFRQISVTVDFFLSKQAWNVIDSFSSFTSVVLAWIEDTRRIYENTTYNVFIGTAKGDTVKQTHEIDLSIITAKSQEEANRLYAQTIATAIADLMTKLKDYSREYNDNGFLRSYYPEDLTVVMNEEVLNKITYLDLPTIFNNDQIKAKFNRDSLPARYFGEIGDAPILKEDNDGTKRSTIEADYAAQVTGPIYHIFAGDLIPAGTSKIVENPATGTLSMTSGIAAGEYYTQDDDIVCKIYGKLPPFMGAFLTGTSFFNPKSLTETHYLTFGHNTLEILKDKPCITIRTDGSIAVESAAAAAAAE